LCIVEVSGDPFICNCTCPTAAKFDEELAKAGITR
jgi:hypothetical protein